LRDSYLKQAEAFYKVIGSATLEKSDKELALRAMQEVQDNLKNPSLILESKFLSEKRSKLQLNVDASEEIEIEQEMQREEAHVNAMEMIADQEINMFMARESAVEAFNVEVQPWCNDKEMWITMDCMPGGSFFPTSNPFPLGAV